MAMAAPTVSIGKVSELSSYEDSESEDDVPIFALNDTAVTWSSAQKKRAAVASLKSDESTKKKVRAASKKQQYPIGTIISKAFEVLGQKKIRSFRGEVKEYYSDVQEYRVVYEDGDAEDITESDVAKYLVAVAAPKSKNNDGNMGAYAYAYAHGDRKKKKSAPIVTIYNADTVDLVAVERLAIGDIVYSAYSETKKRGNDTVFCRGTIEALKQTRWSLTYDVLFNNDEYVASIDKSLVIPEHRYLYENLKQVSTPLISFFKCLVTTCLLTDANQRVDLHRTFLRDLMLEKE